MTNILNKILNLEISAEQTLEWLATDNPYDIELPDVEQNDSTRIEFISYFLDYLKNECQSVLRDTNNESEVNNQKLLRTVPSKANMHINSEQSENLESISMYKSTNSDSDINGSFAMTPIRTNTTWMSPNGVTPEIKTPIRCYSTATPITPNTSQFESPQLCSSPLKNINVISPIANDDKDVARIKWLSRRMSDFVDNNSCTPDSSMTSAHTNSLFSPSNTSRTTPNKLTSGKKNRSKNYSNQKKSPAQNANSRQKNMKPSPTPSLCLGDFIKLEKSNPRKKNKSHSTNQSMEQTPVRMNTSIDSESSSVTPQTKSKRRIKPTKILINSDAENPERETFGVVSRPPIGNLSFSESCTEVSKSKTFEDERELLKLQRQKQPNVASVSDTSSQDLVKSLIVPKTFSPIIPTLELVDNTDILNILAELYGGLLIKNLIPNPMSELYFIISLITSQYKSDEEIESRFMKRKSNEKLSSEAESLKELKETMGCTDLIDDNSEENMDSYVNKSKKEDDVLLRTESNDENDIQLADDDEHHYFTSPHNCVYFATTVLWNGKNILSVFDRPTLALLCENSLMKIFHSELYTFLNELYETKCLQSKNMKPCNNSRTLQTNVCFQVDTDNRDNFPSTTAFSTFRKQRDLFYEILKTWEDNHLVPNWSFHKMLSCKINSMVSMYSDAVNYYHIARLFKSQLLVSIKIGQSEDVLSDANLDVLKSLKHLNPEKLQQLQERLVTPVSSMGPVPPPSFPGIQEFYQNFLRSVSDSKFITILQDCFIQEILELNETQFACSDIDIKESNVDEITKQNYLWCISSLRLLAKFLGFLISLPYESKITTLQAETTQIALRNRIMPPLDLRECIYEAVAHNKLSITIPWVVQYLAMLDSVSFRLPYYLDVCKCLYCIYRDTQYSLHDGTALLLAFSIGWFFELSNFPKDIYFDWIRSFRNKKNELINDIAVYTSRKALSITDGNQGELNKNNIVIDELNIIDDRALYVCCPFLKEIKLLLTSGNSNLNSNNANRHITPVSSKLSQALSATRTISLELQLEDAFFHGHPRSVRRTVDFVVERIVSSCVKFICRTIIPPVKEKSFEVMKTLQKNDEKRDLIVATTTKIKVECLKVIPEMCESKTKISMESLLADDMLPAVKEMCIKIALRMEIERINQWLDSYINNALTTNDMFSKFELLRTDDEEEDDDEKNSIEKKIKVQKETANLDAPWATAVINDVRNSLWELLENNGRWVKLTNEIVLNNVDNIYQTLNGRKHTVSTARRMLYRLSVDYAIHLIAFRPDLYTLKVEDKLIGIWQMQKNNEGELLSDKLLSKLLCPKNIKILMLSKDKNVWQHYGKFIQQMLKHEVLSLDDFSNSCVSLFRYEWHPITLQSISKCMTEALQDYKPGNESVEKLLYLINWTIKTCGTIDDYE
ncbi:hypothetical protein PV327_004553 [Microctonus hyperodae]|uniref:Codanin-1 C-terminal domain-containing protein n=1 Tax=Microctonus hyperodae TaxID=165561 RepID=A0AA39KMT8_MICHY|nr:hypothetical protein PV327_004553 [Microctonus hyperodae]